MNFMTNELHNRRAPANIMGYLAEQDKRVQELFSRANRNDPCPCGSGKKFKQCHGRRG